MKIIKSNRKTLSLCINRQGEPEVRAPFWCSQKEIERFVADHEDWLKKRLAAYRPPKVYSQEELSILRAEANAYFPPKVAEFAALMGVSPSGVKITSAKTRHGSCSPKGGLCFSLYLMENSERAREAVVVHELAHLLRRDHSKEFYRIVETFLPDYQQRVRELKR